MGLLSFVSIPAPQVMESPINSIFRLPFSGDKSILPEKLTECSRIMLLPGSLVLYMLIS